LSSGGPARNTRTHDPVVIVIVIPEVETIVIIAAVIIAAIVIVIGKRGFHSEFIEPRRT
jgi:hypothetical protein